MKLTYTNLRAATGLLSSIAALFAATALSAQTATPPDNKDVLRMEKFVVTGSYLPMAADTKAVPVTLITQDEIAKTGLNANLLEVLQKRMPMLSGNGNLGTTSANTGSGATAGGANASLRNLNTLILINGRRVSDNGIGANGGRNFVDVSQIPVAAIERVEVLTDGASALYGSDAIGGVINVILRSDFQGFEIGGRYGWSDAKGDYAERSAYAIAGASTDKVSITVSGSWAKTDPLLQSDRSISSPITGRTATYSGVVGQGNSFPTAMLATGVNTPRERNPVGPAATAPNLAALIANGTYVATDFTGAAALLDIAPYVTLIIQRESKAGYADFNAKLVGQQLELFGDFLYSQNDSMSQLAAQPSTPNLTLPVGSPYNPLTVPFTQVAFRYLP
ncbi:MAG TPA: TonB-dependent receptor plug domain-containing protein, partial [Candidatus Didemnitutus sp.]|nr:TonB-dependent receptor plug domain-containing protein [Candidatus Didemnitutus sp.]